MGARKLNLVGTLEEWSLNQNVATVRKKLKMNGRRAPDAHLAVYWHALHIE